MHNFKHTIAAFLAVVLIGSLAVAQAAEISTAKAVKSDVNYEDVLVVSNVTQEVEAFSIEETVTSEANQIEENKEIEFVELAGEGLTFPDNALESLRPFEPVAAYVITTTGGLNVRREPSMNSEVLESLTYGQMIDVIGEEGDWYIIPHTENGGKAYVLKEFITTSYEKAREVLLESVMYESGVVSVEGGTLNVRSGAGTDGTLVIDQLSDGDWVVVLDRVNDEWMKVYYANDYSTGFVMSKYVHIAEMVSREKIAENRIKRINAISEEGIIVNVNGSVNCRYMPDENSKVLNTFTKGEKLLIVDRGSEWTKVSYGAYRSTGYIKSEYVMDLDDYNAKYNTSKKTKSKSKSGSSAKITNYNPAPSSKGQAIVNAAAKYIGVRYVYGGTSPSGFDCSGLVQYACREVGISVNRTSRSQYSNGVAVSKSNLQPGDLVFFSKGSGISHVGIYAGNGQVIHAPSPGKRVCYIALSKICSYSTYVGARRVY